MIHNTHDRVLVPPVGILDALDLTTHDNDLTGRNQLTASICGTEVLRNAGWRHLSAQGLRQAIDHLSPLARVESARRVRGKDEVAVQIDNQRIVRSGEESAAFGRDTQNVRARLLDEALGMASVNDRNVQATPFVDTDQVANGLSCDGEHGRVVADKNNAPSGRNSGFDDTDDVRDRETGEQGPHGKVLEARRGRRELVAKSVILHVNADKIVKPGSREAKNARNLFSVEQVGGLVPVNPHATEVVAEKVVKRISRKEAQAVGNPVSLIR